MRMQHKSNHNGLFIESVFALSDHVYFWEKSHRELVIQQKKHKKMNVEYIRYGKDNIQKQPEKSCACSLSVKDMIKCT